MTWRGDTLRSTLLPSMLVSGVGPLSTHQQPSAASAWRRGRSWAAPASRSGCDKRASARPAHHANACAATDQPSPNPKLHPPLLAERIVRLDPAAWGGRLGSAPEAAAWVGRAGVCLRGEENRRVRGRVGCARARRVRVGGARRAGVTRTRRRVRHPAEGGQSPLARPPVQPAPRSVTASGAETPTHPTVPGPPARAPRHLPAPTDPRSGEARRVRHVPSGAESL